MKNLAMILFLALGVGQSAFSAQGPSCVPAPSKLRVAEFDTTGLSDAPNAPDRAYVMSTALPQTAQQQNLDVMCLTELRDPILQKTVLQGFDPTVWNIYTPAPIAQTGCQDACYANSTVLLQSCANYVLDQYVFPCIYLDDELQFQQCMTTACPDLTSQLGVNYPGPASNNAQCIYCEQDAQSGESNNSRIDRCSREPYNGNTAANCKLGYAGQSGTTLISRYPFVETAYHQFQPPSTVQPGVANWGVAYAKIQTPLGPVNLFCSDHATSESGMYTGADQSQNASQDQDLLNYIKSKAQGEPVVYLADTGSGPAVTSSPTGPAKAQWPANFTTLQSGLTDALLANVGSNFLPSSAAACTYGCSSSNPGPATYVDHIMTAGQGTDATGYKANLCENNGGTLFANPVARADSGQTQLSTHAGVLTEVHLAAAPFKVFLAPIVAIDNGKHPGFTVTGTFTLSNTSTSLQPAKDVITLQIANYTLTLPAGSFRPLWNGLNAPYSYTGTVNGASLALGLVPLGGNTFIFSATGSNVPFPGLANPVTVTLIFGDDFGSASVKALVTTL